MTGFVGQSLSSSGQVINPYHPNDSWGLEGPFKTFHSLDFRSSYRAYDNFLSKDVPKWCLEWCLLGGSDRHVAE